MGGIKQAFGEIAKAYRTPCLAQIGGFRPPEDPLTSWFARDAKGVWTFACQMY